MGKQGKARAKERREKRLQEISDLRKLPIDPSERWWSPDTVAVVTGANRGIGYEIARQLASHGLTVIIASRDASRGRVAADEMCQQGFNVDACQLDVTDAASVQSFALWLVDEYGGADILVNNAGVNFNIGSDNSLEFAEKVINTNYFGTKRMTETIIPIMKPSASGARILNVSSRLGRVNGRRNRLGDATLKEQLLREECLSEELIDGMITKFLEDVNQGCLESNGWPQMYTDYSISKLAVNAHTRLTARTLSRRPVGHEIYINCYCPGWVKTEMTGWEGNISAEEAADTAVWVVLQSSEPAIGKFFAERREISF